MNMHKHMEAIFVATLAVVGVGSFAFDSLPEAQADAGKSAAVTRDAVPNVRAIVVRAPTLPRA